MTRSRALLALLTVLAVLATAGAAYVLVFAKPESDTEARIDGDVYVLPKEFLLNVAAGRYAKLTVALVLPHGVIDGKATEGASEAKPPEGFGVLPQEALVRAAVADVVNETAPARLLRRRTRERVQRQILRRIKRTTDVPAAEVVLLDLAVQ